MLNRTLSIVLICSILGCGLALAKIWSHPYYGKLLRAEVSQTDMDRLWLAICEVESGGDISAVNSAEGAYGIAQIRGIMVDDVNRILGEERYQHPNDALDPFKAREMFDIYVEHYFPEGDAEAIARGWNGGPRGPKRSATLAYWNKVVEVL